MIETDKSPATIKIDVETIRFKCKACHQFMVIDSDNIGTDIECPNCGKNTHTPAHVFSMNPFLRPVRRLVGNLKSIQWHFPFFPQFLESVVLMFVVLVMAILYLTVGIAAQIAGMFQSLMLDSRHEIMNGEGLVEKSAYAVSCGIYVMLWLPFWLILLPFTILGWIWKHLRYVGFIIVIVIVTVRLILFFNPELVTLLKDLNSSDKNNKSEQITIESNPSRKEVTPNSPPDLKKLKIQKETILGILH